MKRDPNRLSGETLGLPLKPWLTGSYHYKNGCLFVSPENNSLMLMGNLMFFPDLGDHSCKGKTETRKVIVIPSNHTGSIWQTQ